MTKSKKVLLALVTAWPIIVPMSFMALGWPMSVIIARTQISTIVHGAIMHGVFFAFGGICMLLFMILSPGLSIYYTIHVLQNTKLKEKNNERIRWVWSILHSGIIGEAAYWYRYIWRELETSGNAPCTGRLAPETEDIIYQLASFLIHRKASEACETEMPGMTKSKKLLLALVTAGPVICFAGAFGYLIYLGFIGHLSTAGPPIAIFVILGIAMLLALGLSIYYIIHVLRNTELQDKGTERIFWVRIVLLSATIGQAVYWYMYIWQDNDIQSPNCI